MLRSAGGGLLSTDSRKYIRLLATHVASAHMHRSTCELHLNASQLNTPNIMCASKPSIYAAVSRLLPAGRRRSQAVAASQRSRSCLHHLCCCSCAAARQTPARNKQSGGIDGPAVSPCSDSVCPTAVARWNDRQMQRITTTKCATALLPAKVSNSSWLSPGTSSAFFHSSAQRLLVLVTLQLDKSLYLLHALYVWPSSSRLGAAAQPPKPKSTSCLWQRIGSLALVQTKTMIITFCGSSKV